MKKNDQVKLKRVDKNDLKFLFELLKERDPKTNISHKKMPSYNEHVKFVMSKPYTRWYVIIINDEKNGTIYISKQDEIGIFLKKKIQKKGLGKMALNLLIEKNPRKRFLANVNPKNKKSSKFFSQNDFKLIQYTYELEKKED